MKMNWKKIIPHVLAIVIFLMIALVYCKPALEGKVLQQNDITQWKAMSKDIYNVKEATGEVPLWTNSMFSGMPGYLIAGKTNNVIPYYFTEALSLFLPKPFQFFFLACICFYILSQCVRVNTWVGVIGSLAYAYATYNPIIIAAGHDTKMLSIALLPGFIGSLILIYEKRYWLGAGLTAMFTGALISQNHYQIVYYGIIAAFFMTTAFGIRWILQKEFKHLFTALLFTIIAGLVGTLSNAVVIFPNYEYTKETIRGGSELADKTSKIGKDGLSKDYAFSYSMYMSEPFVMLVPKMFGGSSDQMEIENEKSKAVEALQAMPQELGQQIQSNLRFYWGGIGGTSGPPYAGAIICFLAILGFIVLDNKHKWWIGITMALTIVMSWGGYFEGVNTWLLNHLPMYNKFRAPSMIIVVPTFLLCFIAILSLQKLIFETEDKAKLFNYLKKGLFATAGIFIILFFMYFNFDYQTNEDNEIVKQLAQLKNEQVTQYVKGFLSGLKEDRMHLFFNSMLRSLFFIAISVGVIWLFQRKVLKPMLALAIIGCFTFIDVMAVNITYLNNDNFKDKEENEAAFNPSQIDLQIMQDKSSFRVLDVTQGIQTSFNHGALTSYFHKNIGGYHPAKLSIYQDLIEKQLYNFPNCQPVLNMLNCKYIIYGNPQQPQVQQNSSALGDAWFVKAVKTTTTAKEEMDALTNLHVADTVLVNKSYSSIIKNNFQFDSSASIKLVSNKNDIVSYKSVSKTEMPAVFSEVYYSKGWNAYLNGKKVDYAKVNYVLRGMMLPAGENTIEFKFEPQSHTLGWKLTNIASLLMLLLLAGGFWLDLKRKKII